MNNSLKRSHVPGWLSAGAMALGLCSVANAQSSSSRLATLSKPVPKALAQSIPVGKASASQTLHLCITLTPPNQAALESFAKSVSDPTSPNYGKYLTPAQFGAQFGQTPSTFQAVKNYLTSNGMTVKLAGDNLLSLTVDCTVAQAEAAFHTTVNRYVSLNPSDTGRHEFFSYSTPLYLPASFASAVGSVTGLQNHTKPIPRLVRGKVKQNGVTQPLTPQQAATLYNTAPMHSANHYGQERTVAISSFDGFDINNITLFSQNFNLAHVPGGILNNVSVVTVDGGSGSGPAFGEGDLDQQMVISQAPECFLMIYDGGGDLQPVLAQEAQDDKADIVTESYGWDYDASDAEAAHNLHLQLTAEGITYFLASGDDGTSTLLASEQQAYPDYDTEVTNVGGTVATLNSSGTRSAEVTWFGSAGGWVTSPSVPFNVLPSWQKGTGVPTNLNFRLVPDVALHSAGSNNSNTDPGAYVFYYQGALSTQSGAFSGTSFASPLFAGSFALVEQQLIDEKVLQTTPDLHARMGRINDLIYAQNGNSNIWFDVTSGPSNGQLPNGTTAEPTKGWDFVTGWGSCNFLALANSFAAPAATTLVPATLQTYNGFGTGPTGGISDLGATDGTLYTLKSVSTSIGAISSPEFVYQLATPVPGLSSMNLTLAESAPKGVTCLVYFYNYSQGWWNLMNTTPMTGSTVKINVNPYFNSQYISSKGQVTVVVRALNPTSNGGANFTLSTDQATLTTTPATP